MSLTIASIRNAIRTAESTQRRGEVWDEGVRALHVQVTPNGVVTYYVRYRSGGTQRRLKLGRFPTLTVDEARKRAHDALAEVSKGRDPQIARKADRAALRMVDLLGADGNEGWYLTTYVRTAGKLGTAKSDKGISNDRSYIRTHVRSRSALMKKRIDAVTIADLNAIKADATPSSWRKVRNILLVVFRHAEEEGAIAPGSNPALRTKAVADKKRERFLTPAERQKLELVVREGEATGRRSDGGLSPHMARGIRLLLLTGMRRGDVIALRWEWIDWRHAMIKLPNSKTGARDVPLSPQALSYLREQRGAGAGRIGLVCANENGGGLNPENVERAWQTIRKRAGLEGVRLHDLRHSWASDAVSAGVPLYVVGAALGHRQPGTTARYAHLHDEAIREGLAKAGAAIEAATRGRAARVIK